MTGQGGWPMTVFLTPTAAVLRRHLLPARRAPRHARLPRRCCEAVRRRLREPPRRDHARGADAARETSGALGQLEPSRRDARAGGAVARRSPRAAPRPRTASARRLRRRAEVPPASALEFCCVGRRGETAWRWSSSTLDRDGPRRHLRPARRRLPPLLRRRATGWCPTSRRCSTTTPCSPALYLDGYQALGHERYRRVAEETLDYVLREMTGPEGGFYSRPGRRQRGRGGQVLRLDAGGGRGGAGRRAADAVIAYYDVSADGNFEGAASCTCRSRSRCRPGRTPAALAERAARLLAARAKRVWPGRDDKVLTAWNGLVLARSPRPARCWGARTTWPPADVRRVRAATRMRRDGRLLRTYKDGEARLNGYLEDYAFLRRRPAGALRGHLRARWFGRRRAAGRDDHRPVRRRRGGGFFATAATTSS